MWNKTVLHSIIWCVCVYGFFGLGLFLFYVSKAKKHISTFKLNENNNIHNTLSNGERKKCTWPRIVGCWLLNMHISDEIKYFRWKTAAYRLPAGFNNWKTPCITHKSGNLKREENVLLFFFWNWGKISILCIPNENLKKNKMNPMACTAWNGSDTNVYYIGDLWNI